MGRVIEAFAQFLDGEGDPLAYGWLRFLASNSTNTNKDTYNDPNYQIPNANPLQLDGEGRCPSVFGVGDYRIISYVNDPDEEDSPGEQIQMFDPVSAQGTVEATGTGTVFDAWSSIVTYDLGDIVTRDFGYYRSLGNSNLGFDPLLEPSWWEQVDFLSYYNSTITYETGDLVYYDENLYLSLQDGNVTHTPTTSPAWWRAVATGCKAYLTQSGNFTITSSHLNYLIILTDSAVANATFDLPAMSSTTDKFCLWIYNASDYVLTLDAAGATTVWLNAGGTIDLTKGSLVQIRYNSYLDQWIPSGNNGPILGSQDVGTVLYPVLDLYATDIYTTTMTATGALTLALATIDELHIPSDGPLYFGDSDEVLMFYDSAGTEFNLSVDSGVNVTFANSSVDYWTILSTGPIVPGASNPLADIGSASASLNFIYTDNISLPDNGYALFGGGDDLGISVNGTISSIVSTLPLTIGTNTLQQITFILNSTGVLEMTTAGYLNTTLAFSIADSSPSFYMGNPTEFSITQAGATSPTVLNAATYLMQFNHGGSSVFYYDSTLDVTFTHNLNLANATGIYWDTDAYIQRDLAGVDIAAGVGERIDFYLSSIRRWYISTTGLYPEASDTYQIGGSSNYLEGLYTSELYGNGTSFTFGLSTSYTVEVTDVYEYQDGSLNWHLAFTIVGDNATYQFFSEIGT